MNFRSQSGHTPFTEVFYQVTVERGAGPNDKQHHNEPSSLFCRQGGPSHSNGPRLFSPSLRSPRSPAGASFFRKGRWGTAPSLCFLTKIHIADIPSSWCRVILLSTANGSPLQPPVTKSHCHERGPTVPSRPRLTQRLLLPLERSPRPGGGFCFPKRFPNQSSSGGHARFMVGAY
jgi:hypothetical protein